jgi:hypothetical protein
VWSAGRIATALLGSKSRRIQRAMASRTKDQHLDGAKVRDFFMFCARGRGTWPVLPITAGKVYRWFYSIMRRKKLKSSWKSVLPYKKALMRWATQYQKDPFSVLDADVVDDMRKAFKAEFPVLPKQIKIQITDDLFAAVVLSLSPSNPIDRVDRDLYTVLKIAGTRVSSLVLGADKRRFDRIVRLKHVVFLPSSRNRQRVFMLLPVTKTRSAADPVGMMLERNHNPKSKVCAVESLYRQVRRRKRAGAKGNDVLFWNARSNRPYSRNVFTTRFKGRIDKVASRRIGNTKLKGKPSAYISGISFRKAVLQKLKDMGMSPSQVATYATHKTLAAQMNYVAATVESCAEVAAALYTGL